MYIYGQGQHQKLYEHLLATLVPPSGQAAPTPHGELLRLATKFYGLIHANRNLNTVIASEGYALLEQASMAGAEIAEVARRIVGGSAPAGDFESLIDLVVLHAAEHVQVQNGGGMSLLCFTTLNLQVVAMQVLGRQLTSQEIWHMLPDLESEVRQFLEKLVAKKISEMGLK